MLNIPSYDNPYSTTQATNACAWIRFLALDLSTPGGQGRVEVGVNLDEVSANAYLPPIDTFSVALGEVLVPSDPTANPPVEEVKFYDLDGLLTACAELSASTQGLTPGQAIFATLYQGLLNHPKCVGATQI